MSFALRTGATTRGSNGSIPRRGRSGSAGRSSGAGGNRRGRARRRGAGGRDGAAARRRASRATAPPRAVRASCAHGVRPATAANASVSRQEPCADHRPTGRRERSPAGESIPSDCLCPRLDVRLTTSSREPVADSADVFGEQDSSQFLEPRRAAVCRSGVRLDAKFAASFLEHWRVHDIAEEFRAGRHRLADEGRRVAGARAVTRGLRLLFELQPLCSSPDVFPEQHRVQTPRSRRAGLTHRVDYEIDGLARIQSDGRWAIYDETPEHGILVGFAVRRTSNAPGHRRRDGSEDRLRRRSRRARGGNAAAHGLRRLTPDSDSSRAAAVWSRCGLARPDRPLNPAIESSIALIAWARACRRSAATSHA